MRSYFYRYSNVLKIKHIFALPREALLATRRCACTFLHMEKNIAFSYAKMLSGGEPDASSGPWFAGRAPASRRRSA